MVIAIIALVALLLILLCVLGWALKQHPTKLRLSIKLWRLLHLELEAESAGREPSP